MASRSLFRPAVFLDRDGTVMEDREYLADPDGVSLLDGAGEAIARLNRAGVPVLLVTNQSGIGRGYFSEADFHAVQARLLDLLAARGARLDGVYHCPHGPEAEPPCECRKPSAGLFLRAAREHGVDPGRSFYVGDRLRDVVPGVELGGTGILVGTGLEDLADEVIPDGIQRVDSVVDAIDGILATMPVD